MHDYEWFELIMVIKDSKLSFFFLNFTSSNIVKGETFMLEFIFRYLDDEIRMGIISKMGPLCLIRRIGP